VQNLPPIKKIVCGTNHTIVIGVDGVWKGRWINSKKSLFGWGSNSQMQLSQLEDFSKIENPLIAVYEPIKISGLMETHN
jgi:alpha-tubulin suppressor-like RCC1 family protein